MVRVSCTTAKEVEGGVLCPVPKSKYYVWCVMVHV